MSTPRPSEADVEAVLTPDEVRRFERIEDSGDTQGLTWLVNQTVKSHLAARDAVHEREVVGAAAIGRVLDLDGQVQQARLRAEAAERALADLRGEIKALADEWSAVPVDEDPWSYEKAHILRALLPRDDAAGAGGAE